MSPGCLMLSSASWQLGYLFLYTRPKDGATQLVRRNGNLSVASTVTSSDGVLSLDKCPRLFELWACSMIKTGNSCFDPESNTLRLGATFREFLKILRIHVGGRQLHAIKPQLENLFSCTCTITNNDDLVLVESLSASPKSGKLIGLKMSPKSTG